MNGEFTDLTAEIKTICILSVEIEEYKRSSKRSVTAEINLTLGSEPADMITIILFYNKRGFRQIILCSDILHDIFTWERIKNTYSSRIPREYFICESVNDVLFHLFLLFYENVVLA
jgi:hypothetical protein